MSGGTSWKAQGADLARIKLALLRSDVRWTMRTEQWVRKNFDQTKYTQKAIVQMMCDHVVQGKPVRGQRNSRGNDFHVWFNVDIPIDGIVRFIKFGIEPEEDESPGLLILSAHPPH
jgi:hypothetical protein